MSSSPLYETILVTLKNTKRSQGDDFNSQHSMSYGNHIQEDGKKSTIFEYHDDQRESGYKSIKQEKDGTLKIYSNVEEAFADL